MAGIHCPACHQGYINSLIPRCLGRRGRAQESWSARAPRLGDQPVLELYDSAGAVIWSAPPSATAPSPGPPALVMPIYQARCRESCATRAALPELRTLSSPSDVTLVGLFGLFNTLKKSMLNFRSARSLIFHVSTIFDGLRTNGPVGRTRTAATCALRCSGQRRSDMAWSTELENSTAEVFATSCGSF